MKLGTYRTYFGDRIVLGDVLEGRLVDVQAAYARRLEVEGLDRRDALRRASRTLPCGMNDLLELDPDLGLVRQLADWLHEHRSLEEVAEDCSWPDRRERIGPPVPRARKVWAMGGNYADHRREMAARTGALPEGAETMRGFIKSPTSIVGPYDTVLYPTVSKHVDHEMELAYVIGRRCRHVASKDAMRYVAGFLAFADISARDIGRLDQTRIDRGKGFDTFGVMGPWLVTPDEVGDPYELAIRYWVNGSLRQDGSTKDMIFKIPDQIAWLSEAMTLEPGDVISTGTPAGVGKIEPGDHLRGEVERLGTVENDVVLDSEVDASDNILTEHG